MISGFTSDFELVGFEDVLLAPYSVRVKMKKKGQHFYLFGAGAAFFGDVFLVASSCRENKPTGLF